MSEQRGRYFLRLLNSVVAMGKDEAREEGLTFSGYIEKLIISDIGTKKGREALNIESFELEQCGPENARESEGTALDNSTVPKK